MTDKAFRTWVQQQPSCLDGKFSEYVAGEGRNPACHVRRARDSGIAHKAELSCVPMTQEQHAYQHQHGELAVILRYGRKLDGFVLATPEGAKRWFDEQVEKYVRLWEQSKQGGDNA